MYLASVAHPLLAVVESAGTVALTEHRLGQAGATLSEMMLLTLLPRVSGRQE